jgi:hypothetical protein
MIYAEHKDNVVTILTTMGELVGKYNGVDDHGLLEIKDPRLFTQTEQGPGFLPGVCMTAKMEPEVCRLNPNMVITILEAHPEIMEGYNASVSKIQIAAANSIK